MGPSRGLQILPVVVVDFPAVCLQQFYDFSFVHVVVARYAESFMFQFTRFKQIKAIADGETA